MSVVLSTIILTSVLCIIVFAASNMATDAINGQMENTLFDQAQNIILSLDKLVKRIMYSPESSGYIKTSFRSITPYFSNTGGNLEVSANGTNLLSEPVPLNIIRIKGGSRASVATDRNLLGDGSLLLTDVFSSLGRVQLNQSAGAWITFDYSRVRCINTGTVQYYSGSGYEPYNVLEITTVKIMFGDIQVAEQAAIIVKNTGMVTTQIEMPQSDFQVLVNANGNSKALSLSQIGGNPGYKTLINSVVIRIEISVQG